MKYVKTLLLLLILAAVVLAALILYPLLSEKHKTVPPDTAGMTDSMGASGSVPEEGPDETSVSPSATEKPGEDPSAVTGQEKNPAGTGKGPLSGIRKDPPAEPRETTGGSEEAPPPDTLPAREPAKPAADFTVYDTAGNRVKLSDFTGKPVVVNFWATWCGYCVGELPVFQAAYEKYGGKVRFLMVDLTDGFRESADNALAFVRKKGYTFPLYFDTDLSAASAYGIRSVPMTLFLNADGSLYETRFGALDSAALDRYLRILTGE